MTKSTSILNGSTIGDKGMTRIRSWLSETDEDGVSGKDVLAISTLYIAFGSLVGGLVYLSNVV
jgi:hypothetical protein